MYTILGLTVFFILLVWYLSADIRHLAADGWVLYHSPNCGHCVTQIAQLGKFKSYWMPMVNCKDNPTLCEEKKIKVFPTWLNEKTNQIHQGAILDDANLIDVLTGAPVRVL
jgi:hypothetical protein